MKTSIFFIFILLFCSCKQIRNISNTTEVSNLYKISKIKVDKSLYVIYAEKNDSIFKIISEKKTDHIDCQKIEKGNYYDLKIRPIFPNKELASHLTVSQMAYKESIIKAEEQTHNTIYMADNLSGLCFLKN